MIWLALLPWFALTAHTAVNALLLRRPSLTPTTAASSATSPNSGAGPAAGSEERVAVLLPLRDEADRVTPCIEALLNQRGVAELTVHVLDDGSNDGTAELVRSIAGDKIQLHTGAPLPPGWLGKPHACHQLAALARDADVLVFLDADVVLEPGAIAATLTLLRQLKVTLLSPYPKIIGAGRLVQPLLQWSWLTFLPLRAMEHSARPSLAAAGGQWLIVDRVGYVHAGGHAAVRDDILEDIGLARAIKRSGGRIALADGSRLATCRMYDSWSELVAGYTKSLWASFGSVVGAAITVVTLSLLYVVPPVLAVIWAATGAIQLAVIGGCAYLLGVAGRGIAAAVTGGRSWPDALAQPVSIVLFGWLVVRSFRLRRRGQLSWRGRAL